MGMVIGISGPSCSGKTSLARELARLVGATTLHLDRHFIADAARPIVNGHPSFEQPQQYDGARLLDEVRNAAIGDAPVVVEGFLLFTYPGMLEACDRRVHLDVPHNMLVQRRLARHGSAGDVKGGRIKDADAAWAAHGAEEWNRYGAQQARMRGVEILRPHLMHMTSTPDLLARGLASAWGIA